MLCVLVAVCAAALFAAYRRPARVIADTPSEPAADETVELSYERLAGEAGETPYLALVNKNFAAPDNAPDGLTLAAGSVKTLSVDCMMNGRALEAFVKMFNDAAKIGYGGFRVTEGYRSFEYQKSLYDEAEDKAYVAEPGHSEHHAGLAADISYNGVNIANSAQGRWLAANAYKYGFTLRYAEDKESVTGIPYEPWHYRYVGQPHAYYLFENGICLEEYAEYLKTDRKISVSFGGTDYTVYYLAGGEKIAIPADCSYSASADNAGGIIVTAIN